MRKKDSKLYNNSNKPITLNDILIANYTSSLILECVEYPIDLDKIDMSIIKKYEISRVSIKYWKDNEEYKFVKNKNDNFSLFHKCNSVWWYNVPRYNIKECLKCKKETPGFIILQYNLLK